MHVNTSIYFANIAVSFKMTHRTCLTQFAHDSVFVSQNPFFFLCACTEMDMKRREKDKEANNKRYGQNLKLFPIMNASCERQKQDKCFD